MTAGLRPSLAVVKLGGTTLAEQRSVLEEIAARATRERLVVVHGGGKRLTDWLARMGVDSRFEGGLRVTDDDALEVALGVLRGVVNAELVAALRALGADAVGLSGVDGGLLRGPRAVGLGRVVVPVTVRPVVFEALLDTGALPVIAPLALDEDGVICNVNADDAAATLAGALAGRLVLLTDTDGVRGADGQRIPTLTTEESERLIANGTIGAGMVPKVRCAQRAIEQGAVEVVIADGGAPEAFSRALGDPSFGTRWRAAAGAAPAMRHRGDAPG